MPRSTAAGNLFGSAPRISSRFFLYHPAAPAMLSFPETGGDNQWKAPSVCRNLSRQRNVAMPGQLKNCFAEARKEPPALVPYNKFVRLALHPLTVRFVFLLTNTTQSPR